MLKVPAKRPIPPAASVKVPVIGTAIPAGGGIVRAKALGNVNILNSTATSATEITLFIGFSFHVRNRFGLEAYFSARSSAPRHTCAFGNWGLKKLSNQSNRSLYSV
jgi:hypothetical protein